MFLPFSVVALLIETRFAFLKTNEVYPAKKKFSPKILPENPPKIWPKLARKQAKNSFTFTIRIFWRRATWHFLEYSICCQMEDFGTNRLKFLVKSQTLSFGLKNFSFSGSISTSFGVQSILLLLWRFLKTENEKISFYTRDNTETNKRVKVNFFFFCWFFAFQ